jgi:hypothetical protein
MKKLLMASAILSALFLTNCKKDEATSTPNIATQVVANLSTISANYTPDSLSSVSTSSSAQSSDDPCAHTTNFAVCQSNLIRAYIKVGRNAVNSISDMAAQIGKALGEVPDGNSGTSTDGKISWNKTSAEVWSVLARNSSNASVAYFSVNNGVYSLKVDANNADSNPVDQQIEATITYNSATDWTVDVFFKNNVCDPTDVGDPSKVQIRMTKQNGLWNGKAMVYVPRWQTPGSTAPTCATVAGTNDIAMYTEFVGNHTSTKAALYMIPTTESSTAAITSANYSLPQFCTNFASACGSGTGQISVALSGFGNNWCTTGPNTDPSWNNDCTSNTVVQAASYTASSNWVAPSNLKAYSVTMPTSL